MANTSTKIGRHTDYTPELAQEICNTIASSSYGIKRLCAEHQHWPNKDTIFTWLKNRKEFSDKYAQAKKCQVELLVDEILEIADDSSQDVFTNQDGKIMSNQQAINRAKLKIDSRKWLACKLVPKVYGNKVIGNELDLNSQLSEEILELRARLDEKYKRDY